VKDIPKSQAAIIIASWRCGGTFLTHCLSNHPEIFCVRGEPLHHENAWRKIAKPNQILECIFNQVHYDVGCCKLAYSQAFRESVWSYLVKKQPKVIWLYRENVIRQAVSLLLSKQKSRPMHVMTLKTTPANVALNPDVILSQARRMVKYNRWAKERMRSFKLVLRLSYAQLVGGEQANVAGLEGRATTTICEFLGVSRQNMYGGLRRTNPYPLSETIANWPEVKKAIKNSEFVGLLKDEW
jgi:hypothetical protein